MKNFRFRIEVTAIPASKKDQEPIVIKVLEHTLRDNDLSQFTRLLKEVPFESAIMFHSRDVSHILRDARDTTAIAGGIQFGVSEPRVGHDFKYIDTLVTPNESYSICVHFALKSIKEVVGEEEEEERPEVVPVTQLLLELMKKRIANIPVGTIGSYHLFGLLRLEGKGEDRQLRMTLARPTKRLPYIQEKRIDQALVENHDKQFVVFQMTGDKDWVVLPRFEDDPFALQENGIEIESVANVVVALNYIQENVTKEEFDHWFN